MVVRPEALISNIVGVANQSRITDTKGADKTKVAKVDVADTQNNPKTEAKYAPLQLIKESDEFVIKHSGMVNNKEIRIKLSEFAEQDLKNFIKENPELKFDISDNNYGKFIAANGSYVMFGADSKIMKISRKAPELNSGVDEFVYKVDGKLQLSFRWQKYYDVEQLYSAKGKGNDRNLLKDFETMKRSMTSIDPTVIKVFENIKDGIFNEVEGVTYNGYENKIQSRMKDINRNVDRYVLDVMRFYDLNDQSKVIRTEIELINKYFPTGEKLKIITYSNGKVEVSNVGNVNQPESKTVATA